MFHITEIPQEKSDNFFNINTELTRYVNTLINIFTTDPIRTNNIEEYVYQSFLQIISFIYSITCDLKTDSITFKYYDKRNDRFCNDINGANLYLYTKGLIINQEPSTHFSINNIKTPKFLLAAEEHLKQSQNHFLKIFTTDDTQTLNVYTNQTLMPKTLYRLLMLETTMHNDNNGFLKDFLKDLIDNNLTGVNEKLNNFLESEYAQEIKYKQFANVFTSTNERKIRGLKNELDAFRNSITDYENRIARCAAQLREKTEMLTFLMSQTNEDEDNKKLYKYLCKHPYIKEFTPHDSSGLTLYIESPIIYFNEVPIEKYIAQDFRQPYHKSILKLFLSDEYELWVKSEIEFDTNTFEVYSRNLNRAYKGLFPQPHIMEYSCFGNHRTAIAESAEVHDYIGAIEQISQATMNLNFYDSCVIDTMLEKMTRYRDELTWKKKSTGEMISTHAAIAEYLIEISPDDPAILDVEF